MDGRERKDIPPYGHLVDYLTFGGIYRDVYLRVVNPIHIENIFIQTIHVLAAPQLACEIQINQVVTGLNLQAALLDQRGAEIAVVQSPVDGSNLKLKFESLPEIQLWTLDSPILYTVKVSLLQNEYFIDSVTSRFGFRSAEFRSDGGFYLNGERQQLFGLNRHQTYPYIGAAAPTRLQRQDADIIKFELACNIVRTSHYPQSPHFLDRCDEIGLLVFEEITGWQHIGDEELAGESCSTNWKR